MDSESVETNGIHLNVVQAGPEDGPLIILLHGFPEFSYSWRKLMPLLVSAGYRVWAPDQRGYNLSDKPDGLDAYGIDQLVADVIGLIDAAKAEKAFLVGHDWGAGVAWWAAATHPERIAKMVVMNVPHGKVMKDFIRKSRRQLLKSWYIFFFQIPWLPERMARMGNWRILVNTLKRTSHRGTFSEDDFAHYREAWSQPRAMTSMLNWYRAFLRRAPTVRASPRISVPTLLIWGKQDSVLSSDMAQPSIDLCDNGRLVFIEDASHWVYHERLERVTELITEFLRSE
jgi:pimeloyl-ACP methyl ester carboxylesterase